MKLCFGNPLDWIPVYTDSLEGVRAHGNYIIHNISDLRRGTARIHENQIRVADSGKSLSELVEEMMIRNYAIF